MIFSVTETYSKTGYLRSKDSTQLFYRHFNVTAKKAIVYLLHGFLEHSGRYFHVINRLTDAGFEVFCLDLRGHGHSYGRKGDIDNFIHFEDDFFCGLNYIHKNKKDEKKIFVLGHSMGALVSLRAAVGSLLAIDGLILSSPLFQLNVQVPLLKKWAALLAANLIPQIRLSTGIKGVHLSSDEKLANAYDEDPLVAKNLSVRAVREIFNGYQNVDALALKINSPLFLQVAGNDQVVEPSAAIKWFKQIDLARVDGQLKIYHNFLHEIYNEKKRKEPIDDMLFWLNERI